MGKGVAHGDQTLQVPIAGLDYWDMIRSVPN